MKIGAFVPQGWRMDLNGVAQDNQWQTILDAANNIENLNYESLWVYDHFHTVPKPTPGPATPIVASPAPINFAASTSIFIPFVCYSYMSH